MLPASMWPALLPPRSPVFELRGWLRLAPAALAVLLCAGCQKTYYTMLEQVGVEKRELLTKRVERAKESQGEAQEAS